MLDFPPNLWDLFLAHVFGDARARIESGDERGRLFVNATDEGLLPLMFWADDVPDAIARARASAPAFRALGEQRYRMHHETARQVVDACGADTFLFIKGFEYRFRIYPAPHLRPCADIDIYVPPENLKVVRDRLTQAGYPRVFTKHGQIWSPSSYEITHEVGKLSVEIHRTFGTSVRTSVDYAAVWRDAEEFDAHGFRARQPSPLHSMAYHVLNLAKDELTGSLIHYVDLWLFLQRWPGLLPELGEVCRRWSVERALYASLSLLVRMFPDAASPEIAALTNSLLDARSRTFLDRHVVPDRTRLPSGHREGRLKQLWRKFWLIDGVARRFLFAANHLWIVSSAFVNEALHPRAVARFRASKFPQKS